MDSSHGTFEHLNKLLQAIIQRNKELQIKCLVGAKSEISQLLEHYNSEKTRKVIDSLSKLVTEIETKRKVDGVRPKIAQGKLRRLGNHIKTIHDKNLKELSKHYEHDQNQQIGRAQCVQWQPTDYRMTAVLHHHPDHPHHHQQRQHKQQQQQKQQQWQLQPKQHIQQQPELHHQLPQQKPELHPQEAQQQQPDFYNKESQKQPEVHRQEQQKHPELHHQEPQQQQPELYTHEPQKQPEVHRYELQQRPELHHLEPQKQPELYTHEPQQQPEVHRQEIQHPPELHLQEQQQQPELHHQERQQHPKLHHREPQQQQKYAQTEQQQQQQQHQQQENNINRKPDMNYECDGNIGQETAPNTSDDNEHKDRERNKECKILELTAEIEHLRTRLSQLSSSKMREGNPNIADLGDSNRPTKLAEYFSELYDNEWTNAFEEMSAHKMNETEVIAILLKTVEQSYKYCETTSSKQLSAVQRSFQKQILYPNNSRDDVGHGDKMSYGSKQLQDLLPAIKELRKTFGPFTLPYLKQAFGFFANKEIHEGVNNGTSLKVYVDRCVELCWFMCLQDPPMCLEFCREGDGNTGDFRSYTQTGTTVEFCVWPCVRLYLGGPLMMKGVVQMR